MQLLRTFYRQHEQALGDLRLALARDDRESASHQLHTIKGVAGTLGLMPLADAAGELEAQVNSGRLPFDETALAAKLTATLAALDQLTPPTAEIPAAEVTLPLTDAQCEALQNMLTVLLRYVREQELVPDELIDEIKQHASGTLHDARVSKLCQNLFDFNHDAALNDLDQLNAMLTPVTEN